ncbi:MAG: PD-(D/E)XK nuclease family protein [Desulfovibrio sp.]|nr:PD-(D/E)XK nuclease family protein [Desulfovibrio sp.]
MDINHISPSMLGLFCRCQEAFRRRYVEGIIIPPGIAACIGTGMHRGAEANHKQKMQSGVDMPIGDIQDAARDAYRKAVSDGVFIPAGEEAEAPKELAKGADTAVSLAAAYAVHVAPKINPVAVEEKMTAYVDDLPVPFMGIIDVLDKSDWCPDLKSSGRKWPAGKAAGNMQPPIYRHLLRETRGIADATMSFEVITHNGEHQHVPVEVHDEDIAPVIARAKGLLFALNSGVFLPSEPGHWMCSPKWCGYWYSCPHVPAYKKNARSAA